jgi:hypothetical protein
VFKGDSQRPFTSPSPSNSDDQIGAVLGHINRSQSRSVVEHEPLLVCLAKQVFDTFRTVGDLGHTFAEFLER